MNLFYKLPFLVEMKDSIAKKNWCRKNWRLGGQPTLANQEYWLRTLPNKITIYQ